MVSFVFLLQTVSVPGLSVDALNLLLQFNSVSVVECTQEVLQRLAPSFPNSIFPQCGVNRSAHIL